MLRLGFPVVGVADLDRAAAFWSAALHLTVADEWSSDRWRTLTTPDGDRVLGLMRSDSPPEPRPRLHLDLLVDTTTEQDDEVRRLVELGATLPAWDGYPAEPDFVVIADPEGNVFCVVDLSRAPSSG
ncbi:glyoxalase [Pseudonocardia sp. EC080610-09]|uniref:VOC family protein n=1 Tax=unclassified Pseudonocardia TaxID=2619320 RepID=UPI0006CB0FE5|nr:MULTISPECIES: VOC family protein [unclassified Pseudonocardia]ALE75988.1 glyoxalase [Pseudonocardia sp. EC080625-04]ALL78621.1 glyoxalase [Pseudonocardia sp. EC080610-09]ALL84826.1 glyoxalase [Pseudonocardia sp. EC080619-01]